MDGVHHAVGAVHYAMWYHVIRLRVKVAPTGQAKEATGAPNTPSSGTTPSPAPTGSRRCPASTRTGFSES